MTCLIRAERSVDEIAIGEVHRHSFPTPAEARLVELLRDAGNLTVSLVAKIDHVITGHVAFSPVTSANAARGVGLAPVAVRTDFRRQGLAAELIQRGLQVCQAANFGWCVVLGEPHYYARFGFRSASEFGLIDEYGGGDAFQVVELIPGTLPHHAGLIRYAAEFQSLG